MAENSGEETLVSRRSKRSTAGNRMQEAMAEMTIEEPEADDDQDFSVEIYEEDVFESDFESTDEEEAQREEAEAGEKEAQAEEKQARKIARSRLERATAAAHARQKTTFNPTASSSQIKPQLKPKRQVTLTDASTGGISTRRGKTASSGKRQSKRTHTVMNTSATFERMKKSEQQKALQAPKKSKGEARAFTQGELIARALDNEEGNLVEHRDYLEHEEEKRKRARISRETIKGPLVRWISKSEAVKVSVESETRYQYGYSYATTSSTPGAVSYGQYTFSATPAYYRTGTSQDDSVLSLCPSGVAAAPPNDDRQSTGNTSNTQLQPQTTVEQCPPSIKQLPASETTSTAPTQSAQTPVFNTFTASFQTRVPDQPVITQTKVIERTETINKNYLIHELGQQKDTSKPQWSDTMAALFGDQVKWEDVKVYTGKSRPFSRLRQTCPITGLQAKYMDPRSGVPFADVEAYRTLTSLLNHEYIWSPALGCYTSKAPQETSNDVMS
ncbi:hypothetical protein Moror_1477 [Moniliophthora roreri MCA 2997]|uniref:Vps72/YL1 C-terminal domain-containing protein n=1 Tax=Moniliophthora roreri (strain MCA 2997) TaxID=1381753 RepID=V2XMG2_MONRO|nr:hypothetical protein Moror_1477 [Moniliophthora roreri MCA 2997]